MADLFLESSAGQKNGQQAVSVRARCAGRDKVAARGGGPAQTGSTRRLRWLAR